MNRIYFSRKSTKKYMFYVDRIQGASLDPPGDVDDGGEQSAGGVQRRGANLCIKSGVP